MDILSHLEWLLLALGALPFLGIISTSEVGDTTDGRAGASDGSEAATLGGIAGDPGDSSIQASASNVSRDRAVNAYGSNVARDSAILNQGTLKTGTEFSNITGGVTVETFSDDFAASALNAVAGLSEKTLASIAGSQEKNNSLLSKLSESAATDGASSVNRNLVFVAVAALLAVLGFAWILRR